MHLFSLFCQGGVEECLLKIQELLDKKLKGTPFKHSKITDAELRVESVIVQVELKLIVCVLIIN